MKIKDLLTPDNKQKIKDLSLNIGAILVLNVVIQFILYPFIQRKIGNEAYGVALSLLSLVSITANSVGSAANYSRVINERDLKPANGDYNLFVLFGGLLSAAIGLGYLFTLGILTPLQGILFSLLMLATAFRYYSDVEFKLKGTFFRFFLLYFFVALGYVLGLLVYRFTDNWMTAILTGEVLGILFAIFASSIYRRTFTPSKKIGAVWRSLCFMTSSAVFENLSMNADRLILLAMEGGEAVSVYYTASIFGKVAALLTAPLNSVIISYLVRYDKPLTKKLWSLFAVCGAVIGACLLGGCLLGSYIIVPFLYPDIIHLAKPFFFPAIAGQVFYFVSGVLLVILLRFRGERMQFFFNLGYAIGFFASVILGTHFFGLVGFVWFSLLANALRLLVVILWGFTPSKKATATA